MQLISKYPVDKNIKNPKERETDNYLTERFLCGMIRGDTKKELSKKA